MNGRFITHAASDATALNPFVPISDAARVLILIYFCFWRLLPSVAALDFHNEVRAGLSIVTVILTFSTELLILLPFLMRRFAGTPIGWLHPFILPTVVGIAFGVLLNPARLLAPIAVWSQDTSAIDHILLESWSQSSLLEAQLRVNFINLLALLCTYLGFTLAWPRSIEISQQSIPISGLKLAVFFVLCVIVVLFFLQSQGGVLAHISTLAGGRYRMRELSGHFLVINGFLPYAMLLWYAYRPGALRSPIFLSGFAVAIVLQFVVTGSRSGLFTPIAMLLSVWMFHNRRVPATRVLLLGLVAVLSLGVLGEVRKSGRDGSADLGALVEFNIESAWKASQEELVARSTGTDMAIAALVPEKGNFLLGNTYIAAIGFWIPRSIWQSKPRGAGAHAAALLFSGRDTMDGYSGGGYPVGGAPEAYWNFWYPGIAIVFSIYGVILSAVARWICREPRNPFALVGLLIVNFSLSTPSTTAIVPAMQTMVLLYFLYIFTCRLRFSS